MEFNFGLQFLGLGRCLAIPLQPPKCGGENSLEERFVVFFSPSLAHGIAEKTWIKDRPFGDFQFSFSDWRVFSPMNSEEILWPTWGCKVYVKFLESHASLTRQKHEENSRCSDQNGHIVRTDMWDVVCGFLWMDAVFVNVHNTIEGTSLVEMRKQKRNCRILVPGDARFLLWMLLFFFWDIFWNLVQQNRASKDANGRLWETRSWSTWRLAAGGSNWHIPLLLGHRLD